MPEITDNFVYYGRSGALYKVGPLFVIPQYQPDANDPQFAAMEVVGSLTPGSTVHLTYKVLPGSPNAVQGVRMEVLDSIPFVPTPTATSPLTSGEGDSICIPDPPDEWISVLVPTGATLRSIAAKYGVPARDHPTHQLHDIR